MKSSCRTSIRTAAATRAVGVVVLAVIAMLVSCDQAGPTADPRAAETPEAEAPVTASLEGVPPADAPNVVGHFRLRDRTITVHSSQGGPLFSIARADGEAVDADLTARDFEARHPELWESVRAAVAEGDDAAPVSRYLDASVFGREGFRDPPGAPDRGPPPIELPTNLGN